MATCNACFADPCQCVGNGINHPFGTGDSFGHIPSEIQTLRAALAAEKARAEAAELRAGKAHVCAVAHEAMKARAEKAEKERDRAEQNAIASNREADAARNGQDGFCPHGQTSCVCEERDELKAALSGRTVSCAGCNEALARVAHAEHEAAILRLPSEVEEAKDAVVAIARGFSICTYPNCDCIFHQTHAALDARKVEK